MWAVNHAVSCYFSISHWALALHSLPQHILRSLMLRTGSHTWRSRELRGTEQMHDQMVGGKEKITEGCPVGSIFFQAGESVRSLRLSRASPGQGGGCIPTLMWGNFSERKRNHNSPLNWPPGVHQPCSVLLCHWERAESPGKVVLGEDKETMRDFGPAQSKPTPKLKISTAIGYSSPVKWHCRPSYLPHRQWSSKWDKR